MLEETLRFLDGRVVLYYAGLDHQALPFAEGQTVFKRNSVLHVRYMKALSLVADYIVIPPSFLMYWSASPHARSAYNGLLRFYDAGIVLSPVYAGMSLASDFIEYKSQFGAPQDKSLIGAHSIFLKSLFNSIPLKHRDVRSQSEGFRSLVSNEISLIRGNECVRNELSQALFEDRHSVVVASRSDINDTLLSYLTAGTLSQREYRGFFYANNRAYYKQGAITYDADVSLVGAQRFTAPAKGLFHGARGIVVAYDPEVVIRILSNFGVTSRVLDAMTMGDILNIRASDPFKRFVVSYRDFSKALQNLELRMKRLSGPNIILLKETICGRFMEQYLSENAYRKQIQAYVPMTEAAITAVALGAATFFVSHLLHAILGLVPVALYRTRVIHDLAELVVDLIVQKEAPFLMLVDEVSKLAEDIEAMSGKVLHL